MNDLDLVVVGTGIRTVGQMTVESLAYIRQADKVLYIVSDPVAEAVIADLNPQGAESLFGLYQEGKPRIETYLQMVEKGLAYLRQGKKVCMAAYGHPGVFAFPTHEIVRRARAEGYRARMLPGISAEDCLFADLGVDPAMAGCQSFEATDFLINGRLLDPSANVVLWQIGIIGDTTFKTYGYDTRAMPYLLQKLAYYYAPSHPAAVYEAPIFPGCDPVITWLALNALPFASVTATSTLYIPPGRPATPNLALYHLLGLHAG